MVADIHVEEQYGFAAQITYQNSSRRYIKGSDVDINTSGAWQIARDKGYTKMYLQRMGYHTPRGRVFLMPDYAALVNQNMAKYAIEDTNTSDTIPAYIEDVIGWPSFIKPNDGTLGHHVYRCQDKNDVTAALDELEQHHVNLALVEEAVFLPEYRIVVFDGRLIACYRKFPLTITGDGKQSIAELITTLGEQLIAQGRHVTLNLTESRVQGHIRDAGYTPDSILPVGESLQLLDVANLSAGGSMIDETTSLHDEWHNLCARLAHDLNLRLAGIDFMCSDIRDPEATYTILEVNATPGLSNFASIGSEQAQSVADLYREIFNTPTG